MTTSLIIAVMFSRDLPHTRTLTVVLPESDWRALRDVEPDAVAWLQRQIRSRVAERRRAEEDRAAAAVEWLCGDDY